MVLDHVEIKVPLEGGEGDEVEAVLLDCPLEIAKFLSKYVPKKFKKEDVEFFGMVDEDPVWPAAAKTYAQVKSAVVCARVFGAARWTCVHA